MKLFGVVARGGLLVALLSVPLACRTGRFPTCETDDECSERQEGGARKFCVNLRCVECKVDSDCKAGHVCNRRTNECDKV